MRKIYLDIDNTLVTRERKQAPFLLDFLSAAFANGDVYWLTTHCRDGQLGHVRQYLSGVLSRDCLVFADRVQPTEWSTLKTGAIDFSTDFIWFDDYILEAEKIELEKREVLNSFVQVQLDRFSDHLRKLARML